MTPDVIASFVDGGIPLFIGVYVWLLAYRKVGKPEGRDPRYDAWCERYGPHLKWLGPLLVVFGVIQTVVNLSRAL